MGRLDLGALGRGSLGALKGRKKATWKYLGNFGNFWWPCFFEVSGVKMK